METEPTFEESLKRLEQIVNELERGESELSTALSKYEQGVGLLARCSAQLEKAERSVALLTGVEPDGEPRVSPFDASATAEREPISPPRKPSKAPAPVAPEFDETDPPF